jgi:hypothetical protein
MGAECLESPQKRLRVVIESHLLEHASAVVINPFSGELPLFVEREYAAERKFNPTTGRRQPPPGSELSAADFDFKCNSLLCREAAHDLDMEIRKGAEKAAVIPANRVSPFMMFAPRLIVIPRSPTERIHDPSQVVSILSTHVLLNERDLSADALDR